MDDFRLHYHVSMIVRLLDKLIDDVLDTVGGELDERNICTKTSKLPLNKTTDDDHRELIKIDETGDKVHSLVTDTVSSIKQDARIIFSSHKDKDCVVSSQQNIDAPLDHVERTITTKKQLDKDLIALSQQNDISAIQNQQNDSIVALSQQNDTIVAPSQQDDTIVALSQQNVIIVAQGEHNENTKGSSQFVHAAVASNQQDGNSVTPIQQSDASVALSPQDENIVAPSQHDDNIVASRQQDDTTVAQSRQETIMSPSQQDANIVAPSQHEDINVPPSQHDGANVSLSQFDDIIVSLSQQDDTIVASIQQNDTVGTPSQQDDNNVASSKLGDNIAAPNQHDDNIVAQSQQDDNIAAPNQHEDNILAPSQHDGINVAPRQPGDNFVAPSQHDDKIVSPSQQDDTNVALIQQDDITAAPSQHNDTAVSQSQQNDIIVSPSQQDDTILASSQQVNNIVAPSQQDENIVAPSQQDENIVAPSQQDDSISPLSLQDNNIVSQNQQSDTSVAPSQQDDTSVAPRQRDDNIIAPSQQGGTTVAQSRQDNNSSGQKDTVKDHVCTHVDQQEKKLGTVHFTSPLAVLYEYSVSQDVFEDDTQSLFSSCSDNSIENSMETKTEHTDDAKNTNLPLPVKNAFKDDLQIKDVNLGTIIGLQQNAHGSQPSYSSIKVNDSPCLFSSNEVEVFEKIPLEIGQSADKIISSSEDLLQELPEIDSTEDKGTFREYRDTETHDSPYVHGQRESLMDILSFQQSSKREPASPLIQWQESKKNKMGEEDSGRIGLDISENSPVKKRKLFKCDSVTTPLRKVLKIDNSFDVEEHSGIKMKTICKVNRFDDKETVKSEPFHVDSGPRSVNQVSTDIESFGATHNTTLDVIKETVNNVRDEPFKNHSNQESDVKMMERCSVETLESCEGQKIDKRESISSPKMLKCLVAECLEKLEGYVIFDQYSFGNKVNMNTEEKTELPECQPNDELCIGSIEKDEGDVSASELCCVSESAREISINSANILSQNEYQAMNQIDAKSTDEVRDTEPKNDDHCVPEHEDQCNPISESQTVKETANHFPQEVKKQLNFKSCDGKYVNGMGTNANEMDDTYSNVKDVKDRYDGTMNGYVKIAVDKTEEMVQCSPVFITASQVLSQHSQNSQSSQSSGSTGFIYEAADENIPMADNSDASQQSLRNHSTVALVPVCHSSQQRGTVIEISDNGQEGKDGFEILQPDDDLLQSISDGQKNCLNDLDEYIDKAVEDLTSDSHAVPGEMDESMDSEESSIYGHDEEKKPKLYACDVGLCGDADEPLCSPVANKSVQESVMPVREGCFKWKYTPSCDISPESVVPDLPSEDTVIRIAPLKTCGKPLRLGLSKRQRVHSLHRLHKS